MSATRLLQARLTPSTKLLLLNSPGNPTGAVTPLNILQEILDLARSRGLWLLSDEAYLCILFTGKFTA